MAVCSCNGRMSDCQDTRTYQFSDSCKFVSLNVMLELPAGKDPVSQKIREALIADFVMNSQQPAADGGQTQATQPLLGDGYDIPYLHLAQHPDPARVPFPSLSHAVNLLIFEEIVMDKRKYMTIFTVSAVSFAQRRYVNPGLEAQNLFLYLAFHRRLAENHY